MKSKIIFVCSKCLNRNYHFFMNLNHKNSLSKYCLNCKKHTIHKTSI